MNFHAVLGGEAVEVVQFALLDLCKEVVAGLSRPRQVGLGRLYALQ
ncbi:hypothetical protein G3I40_34520 [Streptomyces sp. SID14478]|nr:hypothetical protein [Streptomyces sp. SID14478]NEB80286.1 hypothetical protein [Streptomyces sp. SID14478]